MTKKQLEEMVRKIINNTPPIKKSLGEAKSNKYSEWTSDANITHVAGNIPVKKFVSYGFQPFFPTDWLNDDERDYADSIWFKLPSSKLSVIQLKFLLGTRPDESGMEDGYFSLWWD